MLLKNVLKLFEYYSKYMKFIWIILIVEKGKIFVNKIVILLKINWGYLCLEILWLTESIFDNLYFLILIPWQILQEVFWGRESGFLPTKQLVCDKFFI